MGYDAQTLFGDQFARIDANAVGAVFNANQRIFQLYRVFLETCGQLAQVFAFTGVRPVFH
ncbi:hypothetical protein D3C86_2030560 [compost metagenome]